MGVGGITPSAEFHAHKNKSSSGLDEIMRIDWKDDGYNQAIGDGVKISFFVAEETGSSEGAYIGVVKTDAADGNISTALVLATGLEGGSVSEAMRIDENGNVGIGDTTPTVELDVNGEIRPTVCSTIGTLGYILLDEQTNTAMGEATFDLSINLDNQSTDTFATYKIFASGQLDGDSGGEYLFRGRFIDTVGNMSTSSGYWAQVNDFGGAEKFSGLANHFRLMILDLGATIRAFTGDYTLRLSADEECNQIIGQTSSVRGNGTEIFCQNVAGGLNQTSSITTRITGMTFSFVNIDTGTPTNNFLNVRVYRLL